MNLMKICESIWYNGFMQKPLSMRTAKFPLLGLSFVPETTDPLEPIDLNPGDKFPVYPRQLYIDSMELVWSVVEQIGDVYALCPSSICFFEYTYLNALPSMVLLNDGTENWEGVVFHGHQRKMPGISIDLAFTKSGTAGTILTYGVDVPYIQPLSMDAYVIAQYVRDYIKK